MLLLASIIPPALTAMRSWEKVDEKILHRKFLCLFQAARILTFCDVFHFVTRSFTDNQNI